MDSASAAPAASWPAMGLDARAKRPCAAKGPPKVPRAASGRDTAPLTLTASSGGPRGAWPLIGRKRAVAMGVFVGLLALSSCLLVKDLKMFAQEAAMPEAPDEFSLNLALRKGAKDAPQLQRLRGLGERETRSSAGTSTSSGKRKGGASPRAGEARGGRRNPQGQPPIAKRVRAPEGANAEPQVMLSQKLVTPAKGRIVEEGEAGKKKQRHHAPSLQQNKGDASGPILTGVAQRDAAPVGALAPAPLVPANPLEPSLPASHHCANWSSPPAPQHPKRSGHRPCPVCYVPVEAALAARPARDRGAERPILEKLTFVSRADSSEKGKKPRFAGHQTLEQRSESFRVSKSMRVHCGFVFGDSPGDGTGFDSSLEDRKYMHSCRDVVVVSAIFGAYDLVQQPSDISPEAARGVCFVMFVDEATRESFLQDGTLQDAAAKHVGLWRLVVVKHLPYGDPRRTGKIPKMLTHRLFPNAQFSIWVDAKLQLRADPYRLLERFLWRGNFTWAISKHYARFDVFEEAERNKAAGKYNNASIDEQVEAYRAEGLTAFSAAKWPIISDVPEGCVIMREHTPISNLLACLWFNEVDRFTSRDQLSFGFSRDKLRAAVPGWNLNMFLDCERRNFVVQVYHKDVLREKFGNATKAIPTERQ